MDTNINLTPNNSFTFVSPFEGTPWSSDEEIYDFVIYQYS